MNRSGRRTSVVVAGVLLLALPCCGVSSRADRDDVLRVQVSGEPEETAVFRAIAEQYTRTEPDREVEVVTVPSKDDHLASLQTAFAAGDPPDVFVVNYREYAPFVTRGAVQPVGPLLSDRGIDLAAYYDEPLAAFTLDDELQCMPQNVSSLVVYVNTGIFARAGVPVPYDGWSFEEFRTVASQLTAGDVDGVYVEPSIIRAAPFVWSNGGRIVDDPVAPTRLTLAEPASRAALQLLVDLHRKDRVTPSEEDLAAQDAETRFTAGRLAMILSSRRDTPAFREVAGLEFDVVPLPVLGQPSSILHSDAYCVAASSDDEAAAADFVAFATGQDGQTLAALGGRSVPSLTEVAESGSFLTPSRAPTHSQVFLDAIPHLRAVPVLPGWPEIEDVTEEYLTRAFYEEDADLDALLAELEDRTTPMFSQP